MHEQRSPNCGPRKNGLTPRLIVLHYTAMQSATGAIDWLCAPEAQVSAHYVIARDGAVTQLVPEDLRAWHAGRGQWGGCWDVNSASIGIELDNDGVSPFAAPLMASLEALLAEMMTRWALGPAQVIGHSDLAPGRKIDPGPRFDWRRLARGGHAIWPSAEDLAATGAVPVDAARFASDLATFGMTHPVDPETRLAALRARFRPGATGPLAEQDMCLAATLARRWPVDPTLGQG
ncbi:N-acetylmuramoyl-L-alanine amidase [Dinoroseobacter sp. S124A]|uniref:N-acetylmuramoyl-L-alanine amidase n=1 Tax=Dinoroseobacter sp. S124A TaxID=3415128 RepID=UPI003C7B769A